MTITPKPLTELTPAPTPMQLLVQAVEKGASVETLTGLMALQERWEKNQARKSFDAAMAAAKAEIKPIKKTEKVDFTSQRGRTAYSYEDMAGIAEAIDHILAKHGLSYRYRTTNTAAAVTVTCIISHRDGHAEENDLSAGFDLSGNKNQIQAIGSTVTYLQRYTLKAALGLSAARDDDGQAAGPPPEVRNWSPAAAARDPLAKPAPRHRAPESGMPMTYKEAQEWSEKILNAVKSAESKQGRLTAMDFGREQMLRMQEYQPGEYASLTKKIDAAVAEASE